MNNLNILVDTLNLHPLKNLQVTKRINGQIVILMLISILSVQGAHGISLSATSGGVDGVGSETINPSMANEGGLSASVSIQGAVLSPLVGTTGTGDLNEYHWVRDSTGKYAEVRAKITKGTNIYYKSSVLPSPGGAVSARNYVSAEEWASTTGAEYVNCSALASYSGQSAVAQMEVFSGSLSNYYNKAYAAGTATSPNVYASQNGDAQGSRIVVTSRDSKGVNSHQLKLDASGSPTAPAKFSGNTISYAGYNATEKITAASGTSLVLEDTRTRGTDVQRVDLRSKDGSLSRTAKSFDSGHIINDIVGLAEVGDSVDVNAGTYKENVWVDKSIALIGQGMPTVDGGSKGSPITLYADNIILEGFNAVNSTKGGGIEVYSNNCIIRSNSASNNLYGIYMLNAGSNTVSGNRANKNMYVGIYLDKSKNNKITSNDASYNSNSALKSTSPAGSGICLDWSDGNTVSGNTATGNLVDGVNFCYSNNNRLLSNAVNKNKEGIYLLSSNYNVLDGNSVTSNLSPGMFIETSRGCTVTNNIVKDNGFTGLNLWKSSDNVLRNNCISGNKYNFDADGYNDIDTSNLINGKKIYYLINKKDMTIDDKSQAGTVYAINCNNITVKNLVISNNDCGVLFRNTTNSRILNNRITDVEGGIFLDCAGSNIVKGNIISNSLENGLFVGWSSDKNTISDNDIRYSQKSGIMVEESWCNTITNNIASYNQMYGLYLLNSGINTATGNTFLGNKIKSVQISGDSQWNVVKNNKT